ncbi:MAG TPA: D-glycero-beta-D-manno-heptose-7-phosphate kinase [Fimbriiglobus sp.]|jgi:D-beta-D-heptose 7-phosphate kinase/D-beta-D-heptose 1-phosphate adenosyltransferase
MASSNRREPERRMNPFDLIPRFRGTPVLIVGDLMLDEFVWGTVNRISPEAPVPVVEVQRRTFVAGGAANAAANVAALGGRAILAGVVGADPAGDRTREILSAAGIDAAPLVSDPSRPTTTKTRIHAHSQQVVRIDHEENGAISREVEDALLSNLAGLLPSVRGCILSDYAKGVVTERFSRTLVALCRSAGVPVVVDPKGVEFAKYAGATLVKPNLVEAGKVLNRDLRDRPAVDRAGRDLLDRLPGSDAVLITQGSNGMTLFERDRPAVHVPARAREVFDVTGAGDTVAATVALALAAGAGLASACRLAAAAAAVAVGKAGTATVSPAELAATEDVLPHRQAA